MSTWSNTAKNSVSFTNLSKSSVTMSNQVKSAIPFYLKQENGSYLLQENGGRIIIRDIDAISWTNLSKN